MATLASIPTKSKSLIFLNSFTYKFSPLVCSNARFKIYLGLLNVTQVIRLFITYGSPSNHAWTSERLFITVLFLIVIFLSIPISPSDFLSGVVTCWSSIVNIPSKPSPELPCPHELPPLPPTVTGELMSPKVPLPLTLAKEVLNIYPFWIVEPLCRFHFRKYSRSISSDVAVFLI